MEQMGIIDSFIRMEVMNVLFLIFELRYRIEMIPKKQRESGNNYSKFVKIRFSLSHDDREYVNLIVAINMYTRLNRSLRYFLKICFNLQAYEKKFNCFRLWLH